MTIKEQQEQSLEWFGIVSVGVETQACVGGKIVHNLGHTHTVTHTHIVTHTHKRDPSENGALGLAEANHYI